MNTPSNQIRPSTAGLIELHVFYVPEELWNAKLNTVSNEAANKFISAGFIRVAPDLKLRVLRERLGEFLIDDAVIDKFLFLKSVGRSLAVVKAKQEQELKLKSFAPPYALQPELYLLPGVEHDGSISASSLTPEGQYYNADCAGFLVPPIRLGSVNPPRQGSGRNPALTESPRKILLSQEEEEEAFTWRGEEKEIVVRQNSGRGKAKEAQEAHTPQKKNLDQTKEAQETRKPRKTNLGKDQIKEAQETHSPVRRKKDAPAAGSRNTTEGSSLKEAKNPMGGNSTRDSGIPESLEDRDLEYASHNKDWQEQPGGRRLGADLLLQREKQLQLDEGGQTLLTQSTRYLSPPAPPLLAFSASGIQVPTFQTEKGKLIEQLEQMKEERKQLERTREELGKKAKGLLEENKLKKQQARDAWKKKYFDTKKITAPLEETVNKLRQELEIHYHKLLNQLEARDVRKRSRAPALAADSKNSMIIQIIKQQYEIDQQKRKLENAKMKLVKELKMRKQATSDLRVLRAELTQKKVQCSLVDPADALLLANA
ncbi:spermatogenesis-associated protein 1 [Rhinatrema bivittatum]|uniref:spermatogenesis-associated protein 1 n=1 Tax=Rhinatrema bivittatum TaxID=194408 RepID=UPI001129B1C7|nr:spermatogenesis-associated protein 1 [Rhinatrema bivittatum]